MQNSITSTVSQRLLNITELSERCGMAVQTIYNRINSKKKEVRESMPPRRHVPHCSKLLFLESDVTAWMQSLVPQFVTAKGTVEVVKRGRGRPRKAEIKARNLYNGALS